MKEAALYHLLQVRACKFEEHASQDFLQGLREIQASLKINSAPSRFELTWIYRGQQYSLLIPSSRFIFYIPGDSPKKAGQAGPSLNYRAANWAEAASLWRQMAKECSLLFPNDIQDEGLGLSPEKPLLAVDRGMTRLLLLAIPGVVGAVLGIALGGALAGAWTLAALWLLAGFGNLLGTTRFPKPLSYTENIVIAAGGLLPLAIVGDTGPVALWLVGLVGVGVVERVNIKAPPALWAAVGALLGLGMLEEGKGGVVSAVILIGALCVVAWLSPIRFPPRKLILLGTGFLGVAGILAIFGPVREVSWGQCHGECYQVVLWVATAVGGSLFCLFSIWWIQGTLFYLVPWFSLLALTGRALITLWGSGESPMVAVSIMALSGLVIVFLVRVVRGSAGVSLA